jgi:hypothetical protein
MKRLLFCFMCIPLLFVTGCSSNKDTYVVKKVLIDVNGKEILRDIDKDTFEEYPIISQDIEVIGDKIIIKENEVIFSGKETKGIIASINENDENIHFAELPTFIIKGAKFVNGEIHMYISVNQTLSYLIYEKK